MASSQHAVYLTRTRTQPVLVRVPEHARLTCARCGENLLGATVALYTRTATGEPMEPWCADCAYTLLRWAGMGAIIDARSAEAE